MRRPGCQRRATFARPAGSVPSMTAPMPRLVPLACLLVLLLAPAAAQAAGRARHGRRRCSAQMRQAGAELGRATSSTSTPGRKLYSIRARDAADAGLGREALHVGDGAAAAGRRPRGSRPTALAETAPAADGVVAGRPLPARRRRPERSTSLDSNRLAQQVAARGDPPDHGPRDRRRVGVRHAPRRAVLGLPRSRSEVGGPLSALTFNRGRTGRSAPYWQNRPAELRRDVLHEAAAPPRRRRRARRPPRPHRRRRPCRSAPGARRRSPSCCGR